MGEASTKSEAAEKYGQRDTIGWAIRDGFCREGEIFDGGEEA